MAARVISELRRDPATSALTVRDLYETRTIAEIQDQALFNVRPMFSSLAGVSAPPPFGGSARSIVVRTDPDRLRACGLVTNDPANAPLPPG